MAKKFVDVLDEELQIGRTIWLYPQGHAGTILEVGEDYVKLQIVQTNSMDCSYFKLNCFWIVRKEDIIGIMDVQQK